MRSSFRHFLACFLTLVVVGATVAAGSTEAQVMRSLKEAMFGKHAQDGRDNRAPVVAHFVSAGGEGFILDETKASTPLLRFDGDDEVFQLSAKPGTNGDVIFRNDVGEPVLKATRLGGMILFSGTRADAGDPAAVTGGASAFTPDHLSPGELWLHMARSALRVSHACDHKVFFNADENKLGDDWLTPFAEAVSVASDALVQVALQADSRRALDNVHEVYLMEGKPPSAHMDKGRLIIKIDPSKGAWGGHPSSKRIINVVMTTAGMDDEIRR